MEDWHTKKGSLIVKSGLAVALVKQFRPIGELLDVGSGNGLFATMLQKALPTQQIICTDTTDFRLSETKAIVPFVPTNVDTPWSFTDARFSAITAWNVLEHVENPSHFFRESNRVLAPKGELFVSMPNIYNLKNRLYFLCTGDMYRFKKSNSHISILTKMVFRKITHPFFSIEKIGYCGKDVPRPLLIIQRLLGEWGLFAHSVYYVLKKK